jgi:hypothetical protein
MNLRSTLLGLLAFFLILTIEAKQVSLYEAEIVAKNFIYITSNKYDNGISYNEIKLTSPYAYEVNGNPVFYAFQMNPGFIIISADDAYVPVIGYSFEGKFIFEEAPSTYKGFILNYADQIIFARENNVEPTAEFISQWNELRNEQIQDMAITRDRDVEPLVDCLWDQGSPYNIYCPEDPAGPGGHVWVGCVATAMAQIMYYWRYPETGTGEHCYTPGNPSYGQQCANFGETEYNWEGMTNSIDILLPQPNAELQYHCAVSVNMNFSPEGSGAYSATVPNSLYMYFRYLGAQYKVKNNYTPSGWIAILKGDINDGAPVYYSGTSPSEGGHAFVCDGYQGDNFHFNFGWSGSGNGYYSLSDVGGFYVNQACIHNFIPSDNEYPYHNTDTITVTNLAGSITDGSGPRENYINSNTAYWLLDPQAGNDSVTNITLTFSRFDVASGDYVKVYDGASTSDDLLGSFSGTDIPAAITSSGNKLLIEFITNGAGNGEGWYAEYRTTSPTWCLGLTQYTEPSMTFSDGSGDFNYQGGATCLFRIKPQFANKITLNFNYFDTEEGGDLLKVFNGSTLVVELSGSEIPEPIVINSGNVLLAWGTNMYDNRQGWEIYYEIDNVGISEASGLEYLEVYPNPSSDEIHIRFEVADNNQLKIKMLNLTGQTVYTEDHINFSGVYQKDISVKDLPAGFYFLEIETSEGTTGQKILVK